MNLLLFSPAEKIYVKVKDTDYSLYQHLPADAYQLSSNLQLMLFHHLFITSLNELEKKNLSQNCVHVNFSIQSQKVNTFIYKQMVGTIIHARFTKQYDKQ